MGFVDRDIRWEIDENDHNIFVFFLNLGAAAHKYHAFCRT